MMMKKIAIASEERLSDLHRLAYSAIRAAKSHDDDRCFDILGYMKQSLNLSVKDLCHSNAIPPLASLRDHENPKLRMEANLLFNSWMKTLYSSGRNSSTCNKDRSRSQEKTAEIKQIDDDHKFFSVQAKKRRRLVKLSDLRDNNTIQTKIHLKQNKPAAAVRELDKTDDQRSRPLETGEIQHKPEEDRKSIAARSLPMMKLSENPRSKAHETGKIKQNPGVCKSVLPTSRTTLQMKKKKQAPLKVSQNLKHCPALTKNSTEMLELFDIAKKSADVANAKGLLAAKAEASICVDTLSLLMDFSIGGTATETRRIMLRLESLTKHKDRKICNSASALLHCWRKNIKDQQH